MQDLDEAITLVREALDLRPQGHPDRSRSLLNLARYFCNRSTRSKQLQDQEELFSLYAQLIRVPKLCLPAIFLPLDHGSAWLRTSSIPESFSHMEHPFDYLLNILSSSKTSHRRSQY